MANTTIYTHVRTEYEKKEDFIIFRSSYDGSGAGDTGFGIAAGGCEIVYFFASHTDRNIALYKIRNQIDQILGGKK